MRLKSDEQGRHGQFREWNVGYYDGGNPHEDGRANNYPWEVVGSANILGEKELAVVGPKIPAPSSLLNNKGQ